MRAKKDMLGHAVGILLSVVLLQACFSPASDPIQPPDINVPTNTPFQPVNNTPTSPAETGGLPSPVPPEQVGPTPTNSFDNPAPTSVSITQPSNNPTAVPPTIPPNNPTAAPPSNPTDPGAPPPPSNPTITPDVPTPPPPGDPHIGIQPYNITAGGTLQIILTDFAANENVTLEVYLNAESYELQDSFVVTVNGDGDLTLSWTVPQNYIVGSYTILAIGQTYGKRISGLFRVR